MKYKALRIKEIITIILPIMILLIMGIGIYYLLGINNPIKETSTQDNDIPVLNPTILLNPSPLSTTIAPPKIPITNFHLYTRVTPITWDHLRPFAKDGDLYWGNVNIPANMAALTFPSFSVLTNKGSDNSLNRYAAINLDGEYHDYHEAYLEAGQIRNFVDQYNGRHKDRTKPLLFVAFYHLNIIDSYPDIVKYPDVVLVGKSFWSVSNIKANSSKYVSLVKQAGKTPVILLGDSKTDFTSDQVLANFHSVIDPEPQGLGLSTVGFYYPQNKDSSLFDTIQILR